MNEEIMRAAGFGQEVDRAKRGECPICGDLIDMKSFRSELEIREYRISGMCQKCQDDTFREQGEIEGW